jgi:hypothetical protein
MSITRGQFFRAIVVGVMTVVGSSCSDPPPRDCQSMLRLADAMDRLQQLPWVATPTAALESMTKLFGPPCSGHVTDDGRSALPDVECRPSDGCSIAAAYASWSNPVPMILIAANGREVCRNVLDRLLRMECEPRPFSGTTRKSCALGSLKVEVVNDCHLTVPRVRLSLLSPYPTTNGGFNKEDWPEIDGSGNSSQ